MNLTSIVIIIFVVVLYIIIRILMSKMTVKRRCVFAGHPTSLDYQNIDVSELPKNDPKYKIGNETINMAGLKQLVVKGKSLECFGIKDEAIVFVKEFRDQDWNETSLKSLIGRFIVFNIDNERTLVEYPLRNIAIVKDGLKLRKVVAILDKNKESDIRTTIQQFLNDNDIDYQKSTDDDKQSLLERCIKKYNFASSYYTNDEFVIMSITYKGGVDKDYSFHSPKYLYGKVEYNTK